MIAKRRGLPWSSCRGPTPPAFPTEVDERINRGDSLSGECAYQDEEFCARAGEVLRQIEGAEAAVIPAVPDRS